MPSSFTRFRLRDKADKSGCQSAGVYEVISLEKEKRRHYMIFDWRADIDYKFRHGYACHDYHGSQKYGLRRKAPR